MPPLEHESTTRRASRAEALAVETAGGSARQTIPLEMSTAGDHAVLVGGKRDHEWRCEVRLRDVGLGILALVVCFIGARSSSARELR